MYRVLESIIFSLHHVNLYVLLQLLLLLLLLDGKVDCGRSIRTSDSKEGSGGRLAQRVGGLARVLAGVLQRGGGNRQRRRCLVEGQLESRTGSQRLVVVKPRQRRLRLGRHVALKPDKTAAFSQTSQPFSRLHFIILILEIYSSLFTILVANIKNKEHKHTSNIDRRR